MLVHRVTVQMSVNNGVPYVIQKIKKKYLLANFSLFFVQHEIFRHLLTFIFSLWVNICFFTQTSVDPFIHIPFRFSFSS